MIGALLDPARAAANSRNRLPDIWRRFREQLGRTILLGLELLVATDIICTVAVTPTFSSVLVLALADPAAMGPSEPSWPSRG